MRLIPLITAIIVTVSLYFLVVERDRLLAFAYGDDAAIGQSTEDLSATGSTLASGAIRVVAVKSEARQVDDAVLLRGETQAARQVDVRAETSGQVISEPLRRGAFITEGQTLCRLDEGTRSATLAEAHARLSEAQARVPEAKARLDEALARLEEAKINDNAAARLSEDGFASESRVASAQAAARAAEAAVASARSGVQATQAGIESAAAGIAAIEKDIERLTITAPFDGLLESDAAELGSLLQPGALCATVIQLDPIKVIGFVPETDVNRVTVGALAGARLSGDKDVQGRVTFLSRSADSTTRTFQVEIEVPNADLSIRDGQTAEILISAEGMQAHLLPASALTLNDDGDLGVRVVNADSQALFTPLTLLRDTAEGVWVTGLPASADVITVGQEYVSDGVPVVPSFEELDQ